MGTLAYSRLQFVVDEPIVAAARVASPVTNDARASAVRVARRRDADMIDRSIDPSECVDRFGFVVRSFDLCLGGQKSERI